MDFGHTSLKASIIQFMCILKIVICEYLLSIGEALWIRLFAKYWLLTAAAIFVWSNTAVSLIIKCNVFKKNLGLVLYEISSKAIPVKTLFKFWSKNCQEIEKNCEFVKCKIAICVNWRRSTLIKVRWEYGSEVFCKFLCRTLYFRTVISKNCISQQSYPRVHFTYKIESCIDVWNIQAVRG